MAAPREFDPVTVDTAVSAFRTVQGRRVAANAMSPRSLATYIRDVEMFARLVGGGRMVDDLDEADIDDALVAYAQSPDTRFTPPRMVLKSQSSVARFRASVSAFMGFAEKEGFLRRNPMGGTVVRPRQSAPASERVALPVETARTVLTAPTGVMAERDSLILRLLMETGVRVSEACAADVSDVEWVDGDPWLRVRHGKGGKQRMVPLTPSTAALIATYVGSRPGPWHGDPPERQATDSRALFVTHRGRRMTPRDMQNVCTRVAARLPHDTRRGFTPHSLRHTMATAALSSGVADVSTVMRLLGHSSLAVTGRYLDEVRDSLLRAVHDNPITGQG